MSEYYRDDMESQPEEAFDSEAERILTGLHRGAAQTAEKANAVAKSAALDAENAGRYAEALRAALEQFQKANRPREAVPTSISMPAVNVETMRGYR